MKTFFKNSFRFITKLRGWDRDLPYTPYPVYARPPHCQHHSPERCIHYQGEPTLPPHSHLKPVVYLRVCSWWCTLCAFEQMCKMICFHHYTKILNFKHFLISYKELR